MRSRHHFPISLAVGFGLAATLSTPLPWPALVAGAALLGTHLVITAALVAALAPVERSLAVAAGVVFAVHVLSDVVWDLWRWQRGTGG